MTSYIENTEMEQITNFLTAKELGMYVLTGKLEAFVTSSEPKSPKKLSYLQEFQQSQAAAAQTIKTNHSLDIMVPTKPKRSKSLSLQTVSGKRSDRRSRASSLGDLSEPSTQRLLSDLTSTMSTCFPDYDFANSKIEQFLCTEVANVMQKVNTHFAELTVEDPLFLGKLWSCIDDVINLRRCEIFSFQPDKSDDNLYESLWSFHFFFYNKESKSLVYLTCAAKSKLRSALDYLSESEDCDEFDDEMIESQSMNEEDDDLNRSQTVINNLCTDEDSAEEMPQWDGVI